MNKSIKYWKSIVWLIIMGVVFLIPSNNLSNAPSIPFISESVHIIMFAVLIWLLIRDLQQNSTPGKRIYILAITFSFSYGILIEILQEVTGMGRKAELKDILFDLFGILLTAGIIMTLSRKKRKSGTKG